MIRRDFIKTAVAVCLAPACPMPVVDTVQSGKLLSITASGGVIRTMVFEPSPALLHSDDVILAIDGLDYSVEAGSRRP